MEDARAVTGQDPYDKYPKKDGVLVIVGKDWRHIGLTVYPLLFKEGAFRIIKDDTTGQWRAFNPAEDGDRWEETKPAPPLIPERFIKSTSWVLKSANYIQKCTLHTGWTIYFFSSEGDPPQGFAADRCHVDEDITGDENWVPELLARLADRRGKFSWSAMPHSTNNALLGMKERADASEEQLGEDSPIRQFKLRFLDNPHIADSEKKKAIERWSAIGPDVLRQRAEGDFTTDSVLMYPNFDMRIHGFSRETLPNLDIPSDWCRYAIIDPGHTVTAVLFVAVPPDEKMWLAYDQLYLRQCNAEIFGREFSKKIKAHFHAFLIDAHGARIRDIGSGRLPVEQYTEQLKQRGVKSHTTGHSFLAGCDDIPARTEATRVALHIRPSGTPQMRVMINTCPDLEREIKRYRKKTNYVNGVAVVTDQPNTRGDCHLVQCLEYLCAYRPKWHQPPIKHTEAEPWWVKWVENRKKRLESESPSYVNCGPMRD